MSPAKHRRTRARARPAASAAAPAAAAPGAGPVRTYRVVVIKEGRFVCPPGNGPPGNGRAF